MRILPGAVLNHRAYNDTRVAFPHCFLESLALTLLFALLFLVQALTHDPVLLASWCHGAVWWLRFYSRYLMSHPLSGWVISRSYTFPTTPDGPDLLTPRVPTSAESASGSSPLVRNIKSSVSDTVIIRDPTPFSGRPGENVRHYVKQCKYAWIGMSGMKEEERQEAQAMTLMSGLRGPALEFAHTPSQDIQGSFELFSQKLIDQFPFEKKVVNKFDVWMQACPQKQGNRSFEEYAESVRRWPKHGLRA
jgi:hypothetical protein